MRNLLIAGLLSLIVFVSGASPPYEYNILGKKKVEMVYSNQDFELNILDVDSELQKTFEVVQFSFVRNKTIAISKFGMFSWYSVTKKRSMLTLYRMNKKLHPPNNHYASIFNSNKKLHNAHYLKISGTEVRIS